MASAIGLPHGAGSNHANAAAPDLPTEPRGRETADEFRARMEAKSARQRSFTADTVKGYATVALSSPVSTERPHAPKPTPRPPAPTPVRTVTRAEQDRLAAVTAYTDGDDLATIAERLGRSTSTVARWLRAAGVDVRPPVAEKVRPCAGTCGRQTRPGNVPKEDAPGTVVRVRDGLCPACARAAEGREPSPRYLTDAERDRIVREYKDGRSVPEIAADLGRAPAPVRQALRAAGVEMRDDRATRSGGRPKTSAEDDPALVEAISAAYAEGRTLEQVVETVHGASSVKFVANVLRRAGVQLRPTRSTQRFTADVLVRARELKAEGLSDQTIGELLGFAQPTVSKYLRGDAIALPARSAPPATPVEEPEQPRALPTVTPKPAADAPPAPLPAELLAFATEATAEARAAAISLLDAAAELAAAARHLSALTDTTEKALAQHELRSAS